MLISMIRFHADCQSRVSLDEATVDEYAHRMSEGAVFPPVTVFFDGSDHWLADGFHRYAAAKGVARLRGNEAEAEIAADVRQGTRTDAVRHALAANAQHGKRREPGDYRKGYDIAVRCGLCEAHDSAAVRELLACSERWARDLTAPERDRLERERNAEAMDRRANGETQAAIAARLGISQQAVAKIEAKHNQRQAAVSCMPPPPFAPSPYSPQPYTPPPPPPPPPRPLPPGLAALNDPASIAWSDLMTRMRDVIEGMDAAEDHDCPRVMASKATALLSDLTQSLARITERLPHDDTH